MSSIEDAFNKDSTFVGYLTLGHGGLERTVDAALALVAGGVDVLEIGVPFSDPIADGPVIQQAMGDALSRGTCPQDALKVAQAIRLKSQVPMILFSYANPLLSAGPAFLFSLKEAGFDGVLIIDLPLEDPLGLSAGCTAAGLERIIVVSPSTPLERMSTYLSSASGFIYYACRKGVTGARQGLPADLSEKVSILKKCVSLPVAVGFGISERLSAAEVLEVADGFVVGSAFVQALEKGASVKELIALAESIDPRRVSHDL